MASSSHRPPPQGYRGDRAAAPTISFGPRLDLIRAAEQRAEMKPLRPSRLIVVEPPGASIAADP